MKPKKLSQKAEIRRYLEAGGKLTQMAALRFWGCFRLASRVYDINNDLWDEWFKKPAVSNFRQVKSERVKTSIGKFVSEYSLKRFD